MTEKKEGTVMGWISVKDRLPDESGRYLTYKEIGGMAIMKYSAKHRVFNTDDNYTADLVKLYGNFAVTHWMPLPDPPIYGGQR